MQPPDYEFWRGIRDALLAIVDTIERHKMKAEHRTAQLREIGLKVVRRAKPILDIAEE